MNMSQPIKMEVLRNDLLFTAYGQPDNIQTNTAGGGPRAKKVSLEYSGEDTPFMPTPPDSPVFAELTTATQDIKPDITKLNSRFEGAQAVPNLEMNPSLHDSYLNTVYSPYHTTSPFCEGAFITSDDPLHFGASNTVLVKQEPDSFPDVFTNPLEVAPMCEPANPHQFMHGWGSQSMSVFEAAPQIKDEYSSIPSPTPSSPFDSTVSMGSYQDPLPDFTSFTVPGIGRDQLNSGGEDADFDSGSEASFSLTTADSEDSLDDISPFDPNNTLQSNVNHTVRPRTHNYKRNTLNQSVAMLKGGGLHEIANQHIPIKKPRGRPRKLAGFPDGDGLFAAPTGRRGRGRRDAMKGNHLWEFIRDLLKDSSFCPKYIRWEEKDEGVFRFVNSEAVASMWGRKKNNPAMTYEKLSRAMRYYYKRDILERVDGRRLVYKFGKNAVGWKQAAGISNDTVDK